MWKHWIHQLLKKWGFYGTLDTDKALREKNKEILDLKHEVERLRGYTIVTIDPAMRSKGYEQSAWNSPERNTDIPPALKDAKYVEQIRTQHNLPRFPHNPLSITRLEAMHSTDWML